MVVLKDRKYIGQVDCDGGLVLRDLRLTRCYFENCYFSLVTDPGLRSRVSNLILSGCSLVNCGVGPCIIEDSTFEDLSISDLLIAWAPIFQHVRFKGNCGKFKVNASAHYNIPAAVQRAFDRERDSVYELLDWALDIQEASFAEFDVRGIPARLIRRNPSCQFVITRELATRDGWRSSLTGPAEQWLFAIDIFLEDEDDDRVIVVPRQGSIDRQRELLQGLQDLREIGVLEPG